MKTAAKDFKMTELGPIPKDWEVKRVDEFAEVTTGNRNTQDAQSNGAYPFYVRSPIVERIDDYSFDTTGVVTAGDGVGTGKVFHFAQGKFGLHQRAYLIYDFDGVDAKYFYWVFSRNFYDRIMQMTAKSSVDSVRREMITGMEIALPPLSEQRKIAAALSDVDEMIAALEKLIEKKRKIKTGAMQRLLTGKTRLPSFKGAWVEKRFEDVFVHVPSKTYQIAAEEYLSGGHFPVVDQGQSTVVGFSNRKDKVFRVNEEGVIVFGDHTRIIKYVDFDFVVGADGTQLLLGNSTIADTRFLSYCLERLDIPNLGYSRHFKYVKDGVYVVPPTLAEQKAIAKVLGDMDEEIAALEAELAKTRQLKQGMMQELLTGKVRLVGWPVSRGERGERRERGGRE